MKICRENPDLKKCGQKYGKIYMKVLLLLATLNRHTSALFK